MAATLLLRLSIFRGWRCRSLRQQKQVGTKVLNVVREALGLELALLGGRALEDSVPEELQPLVGAQG